MPDTGRSRGRLRKQRKTSKSDQQTPSPDEDQELGDATTETSSAKPQLKVPTDPIRQDRADQDYEREAQSRGAARPPGQVSSLPGRPLESRRQPVDGSRPPARPTTQGSVDQPGRSEQNLNERIPTPLPTGESADSDVASPIARYQPKPKRWPWLVLAAASLVLVGAVAYLIGGSDPEPAEQAASTQADSETEADDSAELDFDPPPPTVPNEAGTTSIAVTPADGLIMKLEDFRFSIQTTVADEQTRNTIELATQETYQQFGTTNLTVDSAVATPSWLDSVPTLIRTFWTLVDGSLTITDTETIVRGRATNPETLEEFLGAFRSELGFPPVRNEVEIVPLEAASLQVVSDGGFVTIGGTLPSETLRESIVESAILLFGQARVNDEVVIDSSTFAPFTLTQFGGNMSAFAPFSDFELGVDDGEFYGVLSAGLAFEEAENELTATSKQRLAGFPKLFNGSTWPVRITGHTDGLGSEADNQELSENRAQAVARFFTDQGLNPARFEIVGRGENEPIASNGDEDGRAKNRRVVFEIGNTFDTTAER